MPLSSSPICLPNMKIYCLFHSLHLSQPMKVEGQNFCKLPYIFINSFHKVFIGERARRVYFPRPIPTYITLLVIRQVVLSTCNILSQILSIFRYIMSITHSFRNFIPELSRIISVLKNNITLNNILSILSLCPSNLLRFR